MQNNWFVNGILCIYVIILFFLSPVPHYLFPYPLAFLTGSFPSREASPHFLSCECSFTFYLLRRPSHSPLLSFITKAYVIYTHKFESRFCVVWLILLNITIARFVHFHCPLFMCTTFSLSIYLSLGRHKGPLGIPPRIV